MKICNTVGEINVWLSDEGDVCISQANESRVDDDVILVPLVLVTPVVRAIRLAAKAGKQAGSEAT